MVRGGGWGGRVDNLYGIQQHCAITVRVTCNKVIQENGIQAAQDAEDISIV